MTPEQQKAVKSARLSLSELLSPPGTNASQLVVNVQLLIEELSQTQSALEQAQRERDEALAAMSADTAAVVLAKCALETDRDELQAKFFKSENDHAATIAAMVAAHADIKSKLAQSEACCAARNNALALLTKEIDDMAKGFLRRKPIICPSSDSLHWDGISPADLEPDETDRFLARKWQELLDNTSRKVLRDDCGTGWHSPEEWAAMEAAGAEMRVALSDLSRASVWGNHDLISKTGHLGLCSCQAGPPEKCNVCGNTIRALNILKSTTCGQSFLAERERLLAENASLKSQLEKYATNPR